MKAKLISEARANSYLERMFSKSLNYEWGAGLSSDGQVAPVLSIDSPLVLEDDGSALYEAHIEGVSMHLFLVIRLEGLELIFPLCLVSEEGRKLGWLIAETTKVNKYGEREAVVFLTNDSKQCLAIAFDAKLLVLMLLTSVLLGPTVSRFGSKRCPLCSTMREAEG